MTPQPVGPRIRAVFAVLLALVVLAAAAPALATPVSLLPLEVRRAIAPLFQAIGYLQAIHILAMLLLGFGFLMTFLRGHGLTSLTATYLMVAAAIPFYWSIKWFDLYGEPIYGMSGLVRAELAAASLLICAGAAMGRLLLRQYLLLTVLFLPFYMLNEWLLMSYGFSLIRTDAVIDVGGSLRIHAFGALFGLGVAVKMTPRRTAHVPLATDPTSNRFALLGSMALWVFWPSLCAALVPIREIPITVLNVVFALCGSTLAAGAAAVTMRRKMCATDIAGATLAGGVVIGSVCNIATPPMAILLGGVAGWLATFGYAWLQKQYQRRFRLIDTRGVFNLHGMPGLLGGLAPILFFHESDAGAQASAIGFTVVLSIIPGLLVGKVLSLFGQREKPYEDARDFDCGGKAG